MAEVPEAEYSLPTLHTEMDIVLGATENGLPANLAPDRSVVRSPEIDITTLLRLANQRNERYPGC